MKLLLGNRKALVGMTVLRLFVLIALFAPVIAPGDPLDFVAMANPPPSAEHWLGTTGQAQDVFAQVVWGARVSLGVGFASALALMLSGTTLGVIAGYFAGIVDDSLSLLINVFL